MTAKTKLKLIKLIEKSWFRKFLIITSAILIFLISGFLFLLNNNGVRRVFIFPSVDEGKFVVESRYLDPNPVQGDIQYYIDELLLGSSIERSKMIFARGTKVNSCFIRKGVIYLDLSKELLEIGNGVIDIQSGVKLLEKNIHSNFAGISKVELFVDGKHAYE